MCVIIIKQKADIISEETLENSARINPHGLGITYLDTFETSYHKSTEYEILLTPRPFIAHFRYATVGKVGLSNTHPFICGAQKDELLMQNGTIKGLGTKEKCDSKVLAENLGDMPRKDWKAELEQHDSRFVTINTATKTFQIYNRNDYTKKDGVWYSKPNVLESNLVAVYGTLKRGYNNYSRFLRKSRFVGGGETQTKYPLIIDGLPYLLSAEGVGHNVDVDVFKVTDASLLELDLLEGHPKWYQRREVPINMSDGSILTCWVYFNDSDDVRGREYHKSYSQTPIRKVSLAPYLYEPECRQEELWADDTDESSPFCIECYNDLVKDELSHQTFTCIGCGSSFTDTEVLNSNFNF